MIVDKAKTSKETDKEISKADSTPSTDTYGTERWYKHDKLHRENGPAIKFLNGDKFWFRNNKLHRLDGPAAIHQNGHTSWYLYGERYSESDFGVKVNQMAIPKELFTV